MEDASADVTPELLNALLSGWAAGGRESNMPKEMKDIEKIDKNRSKAGRELTLHSLDQIGFVFWKDYYILAFIETSLYSALSSSILKPGNPLSRSHGHLGPISGTNSKRLEDTGYRQKQREMMHF